MFKKLLTIVLALTLVLSMAACASGGSPETTAAAAPSEQDAVQTTAGSQETQTDTLSGTLEVWSSGEELGRFVEGFHELYPDVTVNITVVPNADFIAKLTPTLAGGQGAPDIFTGESDYVKYLVESGFWDDLKAAPYNADVSDVWDYVAAVGTDSSGTLRALSWQASPGSVMYRRDMAKEVLGTDDPDQVAAMLTDDAAMLDVAAKLKEKGRPIDNVCKFDSAKENVIYITNQSELNLYRLVFVTAQGYVKIVSGGEFDVTRLTIQATRLDEDDRLVMAGAITDQQNIVLRTQEGFFLKYSLEEIPEQKKTARGVRGIRLSAKDEVEDAWILNPNVPNTITFHDREIDLNHFKSTARGGKGPRK